MKTILLIGKMGQVGWELQSALLPIGHVIALDRTQMDLTSAQSIRRTIRGISPDIIVNAAGYTAVDRAEAEPDIAMQINGTAPGLIAEEAKHINALLVHYSTDYVFDGTKTTSYNEEDIPNPLNVYGKSKLAGEHNITATGCAHIVLRTSWIYSSRRTNFVLTMLRLAREKSKLAVVSDQIGSPTWARALASSTAKMIEQVKFPAKETGIYHLSAKGHTSRFDFAKEIIRISKDLSNAKSSWAEINATSTANYPLPAMRPLTVVTSKAKVNRAFGIQLPKWSDQLHMFLKENFSEKL